LHHRRRAARQDGHVRSLVGYPLHWKIPRPNETRLLVRVPAPDLQTTGTAAAAPASWLRLIWQRVTHAGTSTKDSAYRLQRTCAESAAAVSLFEEYVAKLLARELCDSELSVTAQGGNLYCLHEIVPTGGGPSRFQTRPDILIKRGTGTPIGTSVPIFILNANSHSLDTQRFL